MTRSGPPRTSSRSRARRSTTCNRGATPRLETMTRSGPLAGQRDRRRSALTSASSPPPLPPSFPGRSCPTAGVGASPRLAAGPRPGLAPRADASCIRQLEHVSNRTHCQPGQVWFQVRLATPGAPPRGLADTLLVGASPSSPFPHGFWLISYYAWSRTMSASWTFYEGAALARGSPDLPWRFSLPSASLGPVPERPAPKRVVDPSRVVGPKIWVVSSRALRLWSSESGNPAGGKVAGTSSVVPCRLSEGLPKGRGYGGPPA